MVTETTECVARSIHGRNVRFAVILRRKSRSVGKIPGVDQPHGRSLPTEFVAEALDNCGSARNTTYIRSRDELRQIRSEGRSRRIAERQEVAVGVICVKDGQGNLLRQEEGREAKEGD